jgi:hypothetical protein
LNQDHHALISILGTQYGNDIDKAKICAEHGWTWTEGSDHCKVLPLCAVYLQVQVAESSPIVDADDHVVILCQVVKRGEWNATDASIRWRAEDDPPMKALDGSRDHVMYSGWLRQEGIL